MSCFYDLDPQNNWLITQYINISDAAVTDINLMVTFSTGNSFTCTGSCMQSVPIRIYWTNTVNETERNNTSSYDGVVGRLNHIGNDGRLRNAAIVCHMCLFPVVLLECILLLLMREHVCISTGWLFHTQCAQHKITA